MPRRLSPAMIVALVALVVALSGGAFAAGVKIASKDIKDGTIRSLDIRNGTIGSLDIRNGTIKLQDLTPSLRARITRGTPGPAGATGPAGAGGPAGPAYGR